MLLRVFLLFCILVCSCSGGSGDMGDTTGGEDDPIYTVGGYIGSWISDSDPPRGVIILHQGHGWWWQRLTDIAEHYADAGFDVYGFEMPPIPHGPPIEQFYMPVFELIDAIPDEIPIFMVGLSGGGWTTVVCTALNDRIVKGYSVAGDLPLDMREDWELGDWEQVNPLYPYRVMYDMAEGRLLHIYNEFDECCFFYSGREWTEEELGTPFIVDWGQAVHTISEWSEIYILDDIETFVE